MDSLRHILPIIIQASLAAMILSVALQARWSEFGDIIRRPGLLLRAIVAVNIVVPLVAILIVRLFPLDKPAAVGLILMAVAPLAPLVPANAVQAGGKRERVLGLYTWLILIAILIVPATISVVNAVFHARAVAPIGTLAGLILVSAVAPVVLGLLVALIAPGLALRLVPLVTLLSNIVLALLVAALLWIAGREFLSLIGNGTILAFTATTVAGLAAGHLLGGPDPGDRSVLAIAAAIRHPGIAAAIGHVSGADKHTIAATLLFLLNGFVLTTLYKLWLAKRKPRA